MTKNDDGLGNLGTLDNPAMSSGLNDALGEKEKPNAAAELLAGMKAPVGMYEKEIKDNAIGQEVSVSYFNNPEKPKGYVEPLQESNYVKPEQKAPTEVVGIDNQQRIDMQKQLNLQVQNAQVIAQQLNADVANGNLQQSVNRNTASTSPTDTALLQQEGLNQHSQQVMSKQEVLELLQEQNRPNLAGRFSAMSAHVAASDMTAENKENIQQRLNQATLAQAEHVPDSEISSINIYAQQQIKEKSAERG